MVDAERASVGPESCPGAVDVICSEHRQCRAQTMQEARAQLPPGLPGGTAYCQACDQLGLMVRALTPESCPLHYVEVILMQ